MTESALPESWLNDPKRLDLMCRKRGNFGNGITLFTLQSSKHPIFLKFTHNCTIDGQMLHQLVRLPLINWMKDEPTELQINTGTLHYCSMEKEADGNHCSQKSDYGFEYDEGRFNYSFPGFNRDNLEAGNFEQFGQSIKEANIGGE